MKNLNSVIACLILTFSTVFVIAQDVEIASADTSPNLNFVTISQWIPLNAYSIAPSSEKDSLLLSAMPINWAYGVAFGKSENRFTRISVIANWRIEYKVMSEEESFSMDMVGLGLMVDFSEIIYLGVVYPLDILRMNFKQPQILLGVQIALAEN